MKKYWIVAALALGLTAPAGAACRQKRVCNAFGSCQNLTVCDREETPFDSLFDSDWRKPSPPSDPRIKPLPSIPPIGASQCDSVFVDGEWKEVCW